MTPLILTVIGSVVFVVLVALVVWLGFEEIGGLIAACGAIAVLLGPVLVGIVFLASRSVDETNCRNLGERTDRQVRFIERSSWSWDCFALTDNGWVPVDQVVGVEVSR